MLSYPRKHRRGHCSFEEASRIFFFHRNFFKSDARSKHWNLTLLLNTLHLALLDLCIFLSLFNIKSVSTSSQSICDSSSEIAASRLSNSFGAFLGGRLGVAKRCLTGVAAFFFRICLICLFRFSSSSSARIRASSISALSHPIHLSPAGSSRCS